MSTRALIGTETTGGRYLVRAVHHDGYPAAVIPKLTAIVHGLHHGDLAAALATLMAAHWSALWLPGEDGVRAAGKPSANHDGPYAGTVTAETGGDQEWAYLFAGRRIHGYAIVHRPRYRSEFRALACWYVHDLPNITHAELAAVGRAGLELRRMSAFHTTGGKS
jgi:hypothetical protein